MATASGGGQKREARGTVHRSAPASSRRVDRRSDRGGSLPSAWPLPLSSLLVWAARVSVAMGLAIALGYLPYKLYLRSGLVQYVSLRSELTALTARNEQLQASIRELRHELERMKEDPSAMERVARDELGMVRSGEVVFKVE